MNDADDASVNSALRAVFLLIDDRKLELELNDESRSKALLDLWQLPLSARGPLLDICNKLNFQRGSASGGSEPSKSQSPTSDGSDANAIPRTMLESFVFIRWSFWVSILMSVLVFLVGLAFLGVALVQSMTGGVSTTTLTIAGIGLADLVLLFYSRPWKDVAANLANSQQIRMVATSYLAGFALIRNGTTEQRDALRELTDRSLHSIQKMNSQSGSALQPESDEAISPSKEGPTGGN